MRLALAVLLTLALPVTVLAADQATEAQLLTKQVLDLRARVLDLEKQLIAQKPIIDAFQLAQQRAGAELQKEQDDLEKAWQALEVSLRKTLGVKAGTVLDRATLTFTDKEK